MTSRTAFTLGLRLDPDSSEADWYTAWYEDDEGRNRVALRNGRVFWAQRAARVRQFGAPLVPANFGFADEEGDGVEQDLICDVAGTLYAVAHRSPDHEVVVLHCVNFLYDIIGSVKVGLLDPDTRVLDRLAAELTLGDDLSSAVDRVGGTAATIAPIFSTLGRIFAFSTFDAEETVSRE
jgi:hypothetical protein